MEPESVSINRLGAWLKEYLGIKAEVTEGNRLLIEVCFKNEVIASTMVDLKPAKKVDPYQLINWEG